MLVSRLYHLLECDLENVLNLYYALESFYVCTMRGKIIA